MDQQNVRNMLNIFGGDRDGKVKLLMDYTSNPRAVADPYYTGDFESTYRDVLEGVSSLFDQLLNN